MASFGLEVNRATCPFLLGNVLSDVAAESSQSWVTLVTNDSYALGALVLAHSLKRVSTTRKLTLLASDGVSTPMR